MGSRNKSTRAMAGILDVHVHHASGLQSLYAYGEQDVYARFLFGEMDPLSDAVLQTKTIRKGGNRPNFDQSLQIGVPEGQHVLKCEVFMAQPRSRDVLLGYLKLSLDEIMMAKSQKHRKPIEYKLVSNYVNAPAGTLTLTLAYHGRQPMKSVPQWRELSPGKAASWKGGGMTHGLGAVAALQSAVGSELQGGGMAVSREMEGDNVPGEAAELQLGGSLTDKLESSGVDESVLKTTSRAESLLEPTDLISFRGGGGLVADGRPAAVVTGAVISEGKAWEVTDADMHMGLGLRLCSQESLGDTVDLTKAREAGNWPVNLDAPSCLSPGTRQEEVDVSDSGGAGIRLMQLLPLEKCKAAKQESCLGKAGLTVFEQMSDLDVRKPAASAFKPYSSFAMDGLGHSRGLKRPRSASGPTFDSQVSSGAANPFLPTFTEAGSLDSGRNKTGMLDATAISVEIAHVKSHPTLTLESADAAGQSIKHFRGGCDEVVHAMQPAGEFLTLLHAKDEDNHREPCAGHGSYVEDSSMCLRRGLSAKVPVGGEEDSRIDVLVQEHSFFENREKQACGRRMIPVTIPDNRFTPTSVLQVQASDGHSWQAEPAASEQGLSAESNSKFTPPVTSTNRVLPPGTQTICNASNDQHVRNSSSLGPSPDLIWFSNGRTRWGQCAPNGKVLPLESMPVQITQQFGQVIGNNLLRVDHEQVATSSGSTGAELGRSREESLPSSLGPQFLSSARDEPMAGFCNSLLESERILRMPESERILRQQAAAVWQASLVLAREQNKPGSVDVSRSQAQVRAHQQAAAMWQASMGMSKSEAEGLWQDAVSSGTISAEQAREFEQLWTSAAAPQEHLQRPIAGNVMENLEMPEDSEEQRRQGWKDFWVRLDVQRREVATRGGYVRYGSHAFF